MTTNTEERRQRLLDQINRANEEFARRQREEEDRQRRGLPPVSERELRRQTTIPMPTVEDLERAGVEREEAERIVKDLPAAPAPTRLVGEAEARRVKAAEERKQFLEDNVVVGDGEYVSKESFEKLEEADQADLVTLGLAEFTKKVEAEEREQQVSLQRVEPFKSPETGGFILVAALRAGTSPAHLEKAGFTKEDIDNADTQLKALYLLRRDFHAGGALGIDLDEALRVARTDEQVAEAIEAAGFREDDIQAASERIELSDRLQPFKDDQGNYHLASALSAGISRSRLENAGFDIGDIREAEGVVKSQEALAKFADVAAAVASEVPTSLLVNVGFKEKDIRDLQEWVGRLSPEERTLLQEGGVAAVQAFNKARQEVFEQNNFKLSNGEWVSRVWFEGLSPSQQQGVASTKESLDVTGLSPEKKLDRYKAIGLVPNDARFVGSEGGEPTYLRFPSLETLLREGRAVIPTPPPPPAGKTVKEWHAELVEKGQGFFVWQEQEFKVMDGEVVTNERRRGIPIPHPVGLVPIVGTVLLWNQMEPEWKAVSVAADALFLLGPLVRAGTWAVKGLSQVPGAARVSRVLGAEGLAAKRVLNELSKIDPELARQQKAVIEARSTYATRLLDQAKAEANLSRLKKYIGRTNPQAEGLKDLTAHVDKARRAAKAAKAALGQQGDNYVQALQRSKIQQFKDDPRLVSDLSRMSRQIVAQTEDVVADVLGKGKGLKEARAALATATQRLNEAQKRWPGNSTKWSDYLSDQIKAEADLFSVRIGSVEKQGRALATLQENIRLLRDAQKRGATSLNRWIGGVRRPYDFRFPFTSVEDLPKAIQQEARLKGSFTATLRQLDQEWGSAGSLTRGGGAPPKTTPLSGAVITDIERILATQKPRSVPARIVSDTPAAKNITTASLIAAGTAKLALPDTTTRVVPDLATTPSIVPGITTRVVPDPTTRVVPDPTTRVVPDTTPSIVPGITTRVVPDTTTRGVPDTTPSIVPGITTRVVPDTTPSIVPGITTRVVPDPTTRVVPDPTTRVVPDPTTRVVPDPTTRVVPDPTTRVVPDPTPWVDTDPTTTTTPTRPGDPTTPLEPRGGAKGWPKVIPLLLPDGRPLPPGQFPRVIEFAMGKTIVQRNLTTGATDYRVNKGNPTRSPQETLIVVSTSRTKPRRQRLDLGIVDIVFVGARVRFERSTNTGIRARKLRENGMRGS